MKVAETSVKEQGDDSAKKASNEKQKIKDPEMKPPKHLPVDENAGPAKDTPSSEITHKGGKHDSAQKVETHTTPAASTPNAAKKPSSSILDKYRNLVR